MQPNTPQAARFGKKWHDVLSLLGEAIFRKLSDEAGRSRVCVISPKNELNLKKNKSARLESRSRTSRLQLTFSKCDALLHSLSTSTRVLKHPRSPRLGDVGGENGSNCRERIVEAAGKELHASNCTECDQSHDQGILDEVLAFFAFNKA